VCNPIPSKAGQKEKSIKRYQILDLEMEFGGCVIQFHQKLAEKKNSNGIQFLIWRWNFFIYFFLFYFFPGNKKVKLIGYRSF
jgi:hypothetical protein